MADLKISQLSSATALAGTEVVPVVQSGATKKATIDQILSPAAGKGIDFSANGGDVLTQYDEGTWTPAWGGSTGDPIVTYTGRNGYYTRVGNLVTVQFWLEISATSGGSGDLQLKGLPFTSKNATNVTVAGSVGFNNSIAKLVTPQIDANSSAMLFVNQTLTGSTGAVPVSELINGSGKYFMGSITYIV